MKRIAFLSLITLFLSCSEGGEKISTDVVNNPNTASEADGATVEDVALPVISFENELYDFGEITQGEKVKFTYKFKNTGDADLVISSAKGSCGCTVPDWPRQPIAPGQEAEIRVVFNSEGKSGKQHKKVSVVANTQPSTTVVALTGNIIKPAADAAETTEQ